MEQLNIALESILTLEFIYKPIFSNLTTLLVFSIVFLISHLCWISCSKKPLPPGPWGFPILGYLPLISKTMHETLFHLAKDFGPIYRLRIGTKTIVILSDPEVIRDTFKREEFTGRPDDKIYDMFQGYGVINIAGDRWKEQRRFLHSRLRTLGMKVSGPGREHMESRIMTEVESLLQSLATYEGKSVNVNSYITNLSANVVCSMMMSVTFQKDNPIFQRFMDLNHEGFKLFMRADGASYIPLLKYVPGVKKSLQKLKENRKESFDMLQSYVHERRKVFDPTSTKDIIDAYLQEEHTSKMAGKSSDKDYDQQLVQVMCDLFSAGQETVNTTLNWSLIFLLHNKEVMHKVQQELDSVVGRSRLPSLEDMSSLPYTEATIYEVWRRATIVPLGTPHASTKDTTIGDYFIPAGTTVFSNLYSCHMDPKYWSNPEKFDPERFLDSKGKVFKPKQFMPFGVGRRMCLGEVLAKCEIFLSVTSILHVFNLSEPDEGYPSLKGNVGITITPESYKIRFIPREVSFLSTVDPSSSQRTRGL